MRLARFFTVAPGARVAPALVVFCSYLPTSGHRAFLGAGSVAFKRAWVIQEGAVPPVAPTRALALASSEVTLACQGCLLVLHAPVRGRGIAFRGRIRRQGVAPITHGGHFTRGQAADIETVNGSPRTT